MLTFPEQKEETRIEGTTRKSKASIRFNSKRESVSCDRVLLATAALVTAVAAALRVSASRRAGVRWAGMGYWKRTRPSVARRGPAAARRSPLGSS